MSRAVQTWMLIAAALGALVYLDGQSAFAQPVLQLQEAVGGVSLPGVAVVIAVFLWARDLLGSALARSTPTPSQLEPVRGISAPPRQTIPIPAASNFRRAGEPEGLSPYAEPAPAPRAAPERDALSGFDWESTVTGSMSDDGLFLDPSADEGDWLSAAMSRARELDPGTGSKVRMAIGTPTPFSLQFVSVPPDRRRRAVEQFAGFLASIPTPGRATIHYRSCTGDDAARQVVVSTALRQVFPDGNYKVFRQGDSVEIIFKDPDPRWDL